MNYREFNESIQNGTLERLYLFQGEENFTKERSLRRMIGLWEGCMPELNVSVYQETVAEDALIAAIEALPVFCERRLVVVKDLPGLTARGGDMPALCALLERPPETTTVVFYMRNHADGKRALTKALKPYIVEFPKLKEREITQYLRIDARRRKLAWEDGAMERLIFNLGEDMSSIALEAEKLYAVAEGGRITMEDVDRYATRTITANVFQMMDLVLQGRMQAAMEKLDEVLVSGEQPAMLLGGIAYRIRGLQVAKAAALGQMSREEAIGRLRGSRYFFQSASREAAKYSQEQINRAAMAVTEAEYGIKTGRLRDRAAVIAAICSGFGSRR